MASQLPTFPRVIFTIVEPISLLAGALGAFANPDWFIASQITTSPSPSPSTQYDENARLVALQLGNTYGLVFLAASAVLWTTSELRVVRAYLAACWVADISHVGLTCWLLGLERCLAVAEWNAVTWGNVGFTTFLCVTRTAWFLGLFGPNSQQPVPVMEAGGDVGLKKKKAS